MLKCVQWEELTEFQKKHATDQYVYMRSCEEDCTIEKITKNLIGYEVVPGDVNENKELRELVSCRHGFEIDTEDEDYIIVDL